MWTEGVKQFGVYISNKHFEDLPGARFHESCTSYIITMNKTCFVPVLEMFANADGEADTKSTKYVINYELTKGS